MNRRHMLGGAALATISSAVPAIAAAPATSEGAVVAAACRMAAVFKESQRHDDASVDRALSPAERREHSRTRNALTEHTTRMVEQIEAMPAVTPGDAVALVLMAYARAEDAKEHQLSQQDIDRRLEILRASLRSALPVLAAAHGIDLNSIGGAFVGIATDPWRVA